MHAERDHLVTVVFRELRERVEQFGLEFVDVDLRWGVPMRRYRGIVLLPYYAFGRARFMLRQHNCARSRIADSGYPAQAAARAISNSA